MVEPIYCKYDWTQKEAARASREALSLVIRPTVRWMAHFTAFALAVLCIMGIVTMGVSATPVIFLSIIGYWYLIRPIEMRWWQRRRFARRPDAGASIEWAASEEGLVAKVADFAHSEMAWKGLFQCVRVKDGFLIFTTSAIWHWLPDSGFASLEAANQFGLLAAARSPKYENRA